jgi:hypothetical protein
MGERMNGRRDEREKRKTLKVFNLDNPLQAGGVARGRTENKPFPSRIKSGMMSKMFNNSNLSSFGDLKI